MTPELEPLLSSDEPSPLEVVPGAGRQFVIVCDHAGRMIPRALASLGLSNDDLQTHIAWDIGAAGVARELSRELEAPLFLQRYSRLVIDCNRPLSAPDSIPSVSGGVAIPRNQGLTASDAEARAEAIFRPYHAAITRAVAERDEYVFVSVHSFTPELFGVRRPFHAGVLYERDARLATPLLQLLREEPGARHWRQRAVSREPRHGLRHHRIRREPRHALRRARSAAGLGRDRRGATQLGGTLRAAAAPGGG